MLFAFCGLPVVIARSRKLHLRRWLISELGILLVATALFVYLCVCREVYDDAALRDWLAQLADFDEAWAFFKHEDDGVGAGYALRMAELARGG